MRGLSLCVLLLGCAAPAAPAGQVFDPCGAVSLGAEAATAAQRASVDDALAMWRARGVDGPRRAAPGEAADVAVRFRAASPALYGEYDDASATIYVNLAVDDPAQRAITIAHELGHALGLSHVAPSARPSVMNPGNVTLAPTEGDAAELAARWGACPPP